MSLPTALRTLIKRATQLSAALAAAWRASALVNAARGRPVSHLPERLPDAPDHGASSARSFNPSWTIDLGRNRPIHAIRVHGRRNRFAQFDARVRISISSDQERWLLVHAGIHYFSLEAAPGPLEVRLLDTHGGRYVRLEGPSKDMPQPRPVVVLVRRNRGRRLVGRLRRTVRLLRAWGAARAAAPCTPALVDMAADSGLSRSPMQAKHPCWTMDLRSVWPIDRLRIHHRAPRAAAGAARLIVSISEDAAGWERIHEGLHVAGDSAAPGPIEIPLLGMRAARFVRLELPERGEFHVRQVEALVDRRLTQLHTTCERYGFDYRRMLPNRPQHPGRLQYSIDNAPEPFDGRIAAFHLTRTIGRFGNNLKALMNAATLARRLGVGRVYLPPLSQLEIDKPIEAGGVTLLPERLLEQERPGAVLAGPFYARACFSRQLDASPESAFTWALDMFARPIFRRTAVAPSLVPDDTDLAIHVRSGDLFSKPRPHPAYVQPPLAYYQLVIRFALQSLGTRRVILAFEDDRNPCIAALKAWLAEIDLPFMTQSASLAEDIATLLHARHCAFGRGTFGPAIVRLSERMRTVFFPWTMSAGVTAAKAAGIKPIVVVDQAGEYMAPGAWRNSADQRRLMLDYPIGNLVLQEAPPPLPSYRDTMDEA